MSLPAPDDGVDAAASPWLAVDAWRAEHLKPSLEVQGSPCAVPPGTALRVRRGINVCVRKRPVLPQEAAVLSCVRHAGVARPAAEQSIAPDRGEAIVAGTEHGSPNGTTNPDAMVGDVIPRESADTAPLLGVAAKRDALVYDAVSVGGCAQGAVHCHAPEHGQHGVGRLKATGKLSTSTTLVDLAFDGVCSSEAVYHSCVADLVPHAVGGGIGTCLAYGQTGAGKTHTQVQMQAMVARDVFNVLHEQAGTADPAHRSVAVSCFENLGDRCYDLLHQRATRPVREDARGKVHVVGLHEATARNEGEMLELFRRCNSLRASAPTARNPQSSRSHAFFVLRFQPTNGVLRLVDLAGNERASDGLFHSAERLAEMKANNWSLSCLAECLRQQRTAETSTCPHGPVRVPYRNSKLTLLLKDCFIDASAEVPASPGTIVKTAFIACVAPLSTDLRYTRRTLAYASSLRELQAVRDRKGPGATADPEVKPPAQWTRAEFRAWLTTVHQGRFRHYARALPYDGKRFSLMYPGTVSGQAHFGSISQRLVGCPTTGPESDSGPGPEADAKVIFAAFQEAVRSAQAAATARRKLAESATAVSPDDVRKLREFYATFRPDFSTRTKAEKVLRLFMAKASRVPKGLPSRQSDWRWRLVSALGDKFGEDARGFLEESFLTSGPQTAAAVPSVCDR